MKVTVIRTAMIGGGLAYDVYVPVSQVANYQPDRYSTILRGGGKFLNFPEATCPESHWEMEPGLDRLGDWQRHEHQCRRVMLTIAESVFPELTKYRNAGHDELPLLWTNNLLPKGTKETSAELTFDWKGENDAIPTPTRS